MPSKSSPTAWHVLRDRLHALRIRNRRVLAVEGLFTVCAVVSILFLVLTTLESLLYLGSALKTTLIGACLVLATAVLCWRCLWHLRHSVPDQDLARTVDRQFPDLDDRVTMALQLSRQREEKSGASPVLLDAAISDTAGSTREVDFNEADQRHRIVRSAKIFAAAAALVLFAIAAYGAPLSGALHRLSRPLTNFTPPQQTFLDVLPGNVDVTAGGQVTIMAETTGELPEGAILRLAEDGVNGIRCPCGSLLPLSYSHTLREIRENLTYEIEAGDAVSQRFRINAIDRPALGSLRLTYRYPDYTRLEPRTTADGGDIVALKGTRVDLTASASDLDLSEAALHREGIDRSDAMKVENGSAAGSLTVVTDQR